MTPPSPLDAVGARVTFAIEASGQPIDSTYQVVSIDTWVSVNKVPRARIVLFDGTPAGRDFPIANLDTFAPGARLVIRAGYDGETAKIFEGVVVKQGIEIGRSGGSKLVLDLSDEAIKMTLGRKTNVFADITDSDLIGKLIAASGLTSDVAATTTKFEEIVQYHATDWDLMLTRAEANGLVVTVAAGTVTVKKPDTQQTAVLSVDYGTSIVDLQAELDAASQIASDNIFSYSWDYATQTLLKAAPGAVSVNEAGNKTSAELAAVFEGSGQTLQTGATLDQGSLEDWSSAELLRTRLAKILGHVQFRGSARAEVGKTIALAGLGDRFSGTLFMSGVHHGIADNVWLTTVTFGLPARAFAADVARIAAPGAAGQLPPIRGLQTGVVKQVDEDKAGEFRVLLSIPLFRDDDHGAWARLGTFYASSGAGAVFYPEVGDEVIIGFMNEDPRQPVILGSVYSKTRAPPVTPDKENTQKALVTGGGLKITFNDKDKIIQVLTPQGQSITLDDKEGAVSIVDVNQNKVSLSKSGITLESASDVTISGKGDVTIKAGKNLSLAAGATASMKGLDVEHKADGKFSANGDGTAELTATGALTIRGAMVKIN